jgi:alkylhydroperoxidase family enzyme
MTALDAAGPRIAPLEPPYEPDTGELLARWMPPGVGVEPLRLFRTIMRHPELSARMRPLGAAILSSHATVPAELRELMILRTCALAGSEYEWGVHAAAFAGAVGLDERQLAATARGEATDGCFSERQAAVVALADELHHTSTISPSLWARLSAHLDAAQLIELVVTAGWYHAIAYLCNGLAIGSEPWAQRFPAR